MRGAVDAASDVQAASLLRSRGLTPVALRVGADGREIGAGPGLRGEALIEVLFALGQLLTAGASMSAALAAVRAQSQQSPRVERFCREVERRLANGRATSDAFAEALGAGSGYVAALVAAGEAGGDLAGALHRIAAHLRDETALRAGVWGAVSYPLFIAGASVLAFLVLLLVVVPSLTPLLEETGGATPTALSVLVGLSGAVRHGWPWLVGGLAVSLTLLFLAARLGVLRGPAERLLLDGPVKGITRGLVFGGLAATLGQLLLSGTPAPDAFRLAAAGTRLGEARQRLLIAMRGVYEGASVAAVLGRCRGVPASIVRMASLGEQSGALGSTLRQAGEAERGRAIRRIEGYAKVLGPLLIVLLGVLIGVVMGSLLSAVTGLGDAVLG